MTINRISKLTNWGIYHSFTAKKELKNFSKYNVFYGWNGSGKTTLTRVFSSIEKKAIDIHYPHGQIDIKTDVASLTEKNIDGNSINIRVFNEDFISENIDWDKSAKSILLISEEKINERKQLNTLNSQMANDLKKLEINKSSLAGLEKTKKDFLSEKALFIKKAMKLIDTSDRYYFNYDKTKLEAFIRENEDKVQDVSNVLPDEELEQLKKTITPVSKSKISTYIHPLDELLIKEGLGRIQKLLITNIKSNIIDRLKDNPDIQKWVFDGIQIHKNHSSSVCEYCGNEFNNLFLDKLEAHFSNEFAELLVKLDAARKWLNDIITREINLPDSIVFYEEYVQKYDQVRESIVKVNGDLLTELENIQNCLVDKHNDPFKSQELDIGNAINLSELLNEKTELYNSLVLEHNSKCENFESELVNSKKKIELHFTTQEVIDKQYFDLLTNIEKQAQKVNECNVELEIINTQILELERLLSNETLGAAKFNAKLHDFLGRNDISLSFNPDDKGYRIVRKNEPDKHTNTLSEGEKTAIAFIYYLVKISENDNEVSNTILVIDDPISSFDSNHLFNAFTFLVQSCSECLQLFVLTHNFWFFKLVRDWLKKDTLNSVSSFYTIYNVYGELGRNAEIINCNKTLLSYHSEYHFLFSTLLKHRDSTSIDFELSYSLANISRRLLESFMTFKYPNVKGIKAAIEFSGYDKMKGEKIYWYVQKYSHSDRIEAHENIPDNLLSEGENIIKDVLDLIKIVDEEHYNQLCAICSS